MHSHSGLSILIPIYDFELLSLVYDLQHQATQLNIPFEILCYDDASSMQSIKQSNRKIKRLDHVIYKEFQQNKGRSRIRNEMARDCKFDLLLFIDSDSLLLSDDFIKKYLEKASECQVLAGGTVYTKMPSEKYSLRYKYGKEREELPASVRRKEPYKNLSLNNLMLHKKVFLQHLLDENILGYGHEDTKFALSLKQSGIKICHIDNPVEHIGLEENAVFLAKTEDGIANFFYLIKQGFVQQTKLYKAYIFLQKTRLSLIFLLFYKVFDNALMKNLLSANPSIFLFDLYKLKLLIEYSREN